MKYALLIYTAATADEYPTGAGPIEHPPAGVLPDMVAYTRAVRDAGALVAAEQLTHSDTATSVRVRGEGRLLTDGPFMETKEHLLGFYLIDVPGLDEALEWATRMPCSTFGTVEVRAVASGQPWQEVLG